MSPWSPHHQEAADSTDLPKSALEITPQLRAPLGALLEELSHSSFLGILVWVSKMEIKVLAHLRQSSQE